jgi:hypothetical protein
MLRPVAKSRPAPGIVLSRAVVRAGDLLGLTQKQLAQILGVSAASVSRLPERAIDPESKEGELAVLLLRMFRSLDALLGGDAQKCRAWFHAENHHLKGVPSELVTRVPGLVRVIEYLDAMRGKI